MSVPPNLLSDVENSAPLTWSDTLSAYLGASNEDAVYRAFFKDYLAEAVAGHLLEGVRHWLEVGPGPGTKTRDLHEQVSRHRIENSQVTLVEPDATWNRHLRRELSQPLQPTGWQLHTQCCTFEDFVRHSPGEELLSINFFTMVHVLFSIEILDSLIQFVETRRHGPPCLLFLAAESPESDFSNIRVLLEQNGVSAPRSLVPDAHDNLLKQGFAVEEYQLSDQTLKFDRHLVLTDDNHWLLPFLLGDSRSQYASRTSDERATARHVVRGFIEALPADTLSVPDTGIVAYL